MPQQFKYEAVSPDGTVTAGTLVAPEAAAVEETLRRQQLMPISVTEIKKKHAGSLFGFMKKSSYEDLIVFTNSLASLYRAGIPLLRALEIIKIGPDDSRFNQVLGRVRDGVQSGHSLSDSMRDYPDVFSGIYANCISAGEESGQLEYTLDELAEMLERDMELNRQIKSGIRYPAMVITAIAAAFFVLMTFVVPKFIAFYDSFQAELPLPTRIVIGVSDFFSSFWYLILGGVIGMAFAIRAYMRTEKGGYNVHRLLLKAPVIGQLVIKGNIARFTLLFKILIAAGLPLVKSLNILSTTVKNFAIAAEIRKMEDMFRRGREADLTTEEFEFFPEQALHMLSIGLESGSLDSILGEIGSHYSKQVFYTSRHLTAIIEPILTVVLGIFILILALAIFLPMWNLLQVFKG